MTFEAIVFTDKWKSQRINVSNTFHDFHKQLSLAFCGYSIEVEISKPMMHVSLYTLANIVLLTEYNILAPLCESIAVII